MAASLKERAQRRSAEVYQAAIRDALAEGNGRRALHLAIRALLSEAAKIRRRRPASASLADAELAGSIAAIAAGLHAYKPRKDRRCVSIRARRYQGRPKTTQTPDRRLCVLAFVRLGAEHHRRGSRAGGVPLL